ncbi:hypothetical protein SAMN05216404_1288 [Nitrosospira multiformis]|uniref:Uncharacterized protein n=1 Tax=Nitrosospira multiformis TaxID=1231 RepID=A0A1H8Q689_9PROT|nr:hypothetical protein SAMN05216404_1288 [Nitrosospira multiformis]
MPNMLTMTSARTVGSETVFYQGTDELEYEYTSRPSSCDQEEGDSGHCVSVR